MGAANLNVAQEVVCLVGERADWRTRRMVQEAESGSWSRAQARLPEWYVVRSVFLGSLLGEGRHTGFPIRGALILPCLTVPA